MSELPKFVLQQLQASATPGEHPPADVLAAFAEQGLSGAERDRLLAHLAGCDACREVVFCALPEAEAGQASVASAPSRRRSWYSTWRWAGVAAGIVVMVGVAVIFRGGPGPAGETVATTRKAPVAVQQRDTQAAFDKQVASAPVAPPTPTPSPEARLETRQSAAKAATGARLLAKDMWSKGAPALSEPALDNKIANQRTLQKSADELALKAAAPVPVASAATATTAIPTATGNAAPVSAAQPGVMIASNMPERAVGKKKLAPATRWMLSTDGTLMRSTDAGTNWQTVPFEGNVVFRAVAVYGAKVWAGGQGGVLYYSADDGSQWQRLLPSASGEAPTEDISKLAFRDAQHGTLTTAGGQSWTTSDGGQTWQKQ